MRGIVYVSMLSIVVLVVGCGGGGGGTDPGPTASSRTAEGWALFENGDYTGAIEKFNQALSLSGTYADAYNGLGWSWVKRDSLSRSVGEFTLSISNGLDVEPNAGLSAVYRDLEPNATYLPLAIASVLVVLGEDLRYEFPHDAEFDWHDLRLIKAQSHYGLSEYVEANVEVDSLGGAVQDEGSGSFVEDLGAEIEYLETVHGG